MNPQSCALLVTGGDAPPWQVMQQRMTEFSFVCAADSGLDVLRSWGVKPDLVVGDMDSIADPSVLAEYPDVMPFPRDKDDTDTEIGIRALRSRGFGRIVIAGGGGGRLDHLLAVRALLERPDGPDEWLTRSERVVRLEDPTTFNVNAGSTISVFPLAGGASGMKSSGLKWPLDGLWWDQGHFGVSNIAVADRIAIDPGERPIFVILPLQ